MQDALGALERDALRPYYLLYGEETFLVERGLRVLRERLLPAGRPGMWRPVWGDESADSLAAALGDLRSPPLFGGSQVLVVRRTDGLREEGQDHVLAALPTLGAGGTLVLVARTADQRRRLFAACVRAGAAYGFPPLEPRAAPAWVARLAREQGSEIAPAAVQEILDRSGSDLGILVGEIEKLVLHAGPGVRIQPTHVRSVVAAVRSHAVEELSDRLARRDLAGATRALRQLLAEGEPPLRVLAFLAANLRRALAVAELAEAGLGPDDIAARLGMPLWVVSRSLDRGRAADLIRALYTLRRLDQELKSTRPGAAVFEAALLEIARP